MSNERTFPKSVKPGIPKLPMSLPEDWQKIKMKDVFEVVQEDRKAYIEDQSEYTLVTVKRSRGGVEKRGILKGEQIKVKSQFYLKEGDFLISKRQIVHGACGIVPNMLNNAIVSNEYLILRPKQGISLLFLKYYSHSVYFQQTCFHSSIGVHIEKMIFKPKWWFKFFHYLPKIEEQKRMATILSTWDAAIEKLDQLIAQKKQLKKGLMQQLLTGQVRFPEFVPAGGTKYKETKVGRIPEDWEVRRLGDIGTFFKGKGISKSDIQESGLPAVRYGELYTTYRIFIKNCVSHISESVAEGSTLASKFDILFPGSGETSEEIGMPSVLLVEKAYISGDIIAFTPSNLDPLFLAYALNSSYAIRERASVAQGVSVVHIYSRNLKESRIIVPPVIEQRKISKTLDISEREIEKLELERNYLQLQKKGLMQQLLTGAIRVKTD